MKDIICPNCKKAFQVDDSVYAAIANQVRTNEFYEELSERVKEMQIRTKAEEEKALLKAEKTHAEALSEKTREIGALTAEIARLRSTVEGFESRRKSDLTTLEAEKSKEMLEAVAGKDRRIAELEREITQKQNELKVKVMEAENSGKELVSSKDKEIIELRAELKNQKLASENRESQLREQHKLQLQDKESEIERLKDFKLRLSTKMVGETLELHCQNLFDQARSFGQFPNAEFGKDNTVVDGTKGDYIFRDFIDSREYVSIMFEMKNEVETTQAKHRNEDFFDKLDKDRRKKDCEYAVLVSMLEQGNELYESGIVDVSYRYPKMLVIRPQFFLPVLRLITEAARKGFMERKTLVEELEKARSDSYDFSRFQEKLERFRTSFSNNITAAHKKFVAATDGIDKAIEALEKQIKSLRAIKANFEASEQRLLRANESVEEDLTVRKLTHGIPSIRKLIEESETE